MDNKTVDLNKLAHDSAEQDERHKKQQAETRHQRASTVAGPVLAEVQRRLERHEEDDIRFLEVLRSVVNGDGDVEAATQTLRSQVEQLTNERDEAVAERDRATKELQEVRSGVDHLTKEKNRHATRAQQLADELKSHNLPVPPVDDEEDGDGLEPKPSDASDQQEINRTGRTDAVKNWVRQKKDRFGSKPQPQDQ